MTFVLENKNFFFFFTNLYIPIYACILLFFSREFQPMVSAPDDSSLSSDQDTNQLS